MARLLTLTGPGGVGKTHLGPRAAAELRPDYALAEHQAIDDTPLEPRASMVTAIAGGAGG